MCTQTQATVQVLILPQLHTSLLRDFLFLERRRDWNGTATIPLFNVLFILRLFLNSIESANRLLLDNWRTCHLVIWHTLYEKHSHTFLIQCQIKEAVGAATQPCLCLLCTQPCVCVNSCVFLFPFFLGCCLSSLAAVPFRTHMATVSYFLHCIFPSAVHMCAGTVIISGVNTARRRYRFDTPVSALNPVSRLRVKVTRPTENEKATIYGGGCHWGEANAAVLLVSRESDGPLRRWHQ